LDQTCLPATTSTTATSVFVSSHFFLMESHKLVQISC